MKNFGLQKKNFKTHRVLLIFLAYLFIISVFAGCTEKSPDDFSAVLKDSSYEQTEEENSSLISPDENTGTGNETLSADENYKSSSQNRSYPYLIPEEITGPEYTKRTFTTKFEKNEYSVEFDVNMSILAGAQNADKSLAAHIAKEPDEIQIEFYKSFFEGASNDVFFKEISKKLRHVKIANGFSDEEYLEYLIAFVQQIPYDSQAGNTRFPIEVIFDGKGDCDEKSMLLIGLLQESGYDTALILFPGKGHAVAGIRIIPQGDIGFRLYKSSDSRKYLFIEATSPGYIGLYPDEYENEDAVVIPVTSKGMAYSNYNYVAYIVDNKRKIEDRIIFFEKQLTEWYEEISVLETKLRNPEEYYTYQKDYDSDYNSYLSLVNNYNDYYEIYQKNIAVYNFIVTYPYDVQGVRREIFNSKVNEIDY